MPFLFPLYLAGLAALALPVIFHLIRRTPRGQTPFSSLMFLAPSPPRITRRSRLDQLLLLFLRAIALTLLSLAFARPFLREASQLGLDFQAGQRVAILVDTSASMRRADLWKQAQQQVKEVLSHLKPTDRVALFTYDADVKTLVDFDDPTVLEGRRRDALLQQRLSEAAPTWLADDLGNALALVADRLDALDRGQKADSDLLRRLVLVSDFCEGSPLESLQAYEWPSHVELEVHTVAPKDSTNAGLQVAGGALEDAQASATGAEGEDATRNGEGVAPIAAHRMRIVNAADSAAEQFQLAWQDAQGQPIGLPLKAYVPPGQSRVVAMPDSGRTGAVRLTLEGDAHDFDNTVYAAPREREEFEIVYLGADVADDPQGTRYYVERAFPSTPQRRIRVTARQTHEPLESPGQAPPRLVVVVGAIDANRLSQLLGYLERGGRALYALAESGSPEAMQIWGEPAPVIAESEEGDYALLGTLDFAHPLLAPFADPRFSDFTKIHFWRHRRVSWETQPETARDDLHVLARFDNGDPALIERTVGLGRMYLLTTTWRPGDSQLARSSKFVPLLFGMSGGESRDASLPTLVGEPLRLPTPGSDRPAILRTPDDARTEIAATDETFTATDRPGVYTLGDRHYLVALDPHESQTAPRNVEELERFGVQLTGVAQRAVAEQRQRHLRDVELENRQKIWRWMLAAALVVLGIETWLAGRQSRVPPATTESAA